MIKAYGGNIVVVGDGYKDNEVAVIEREKQRKEWLMEWRMLFSKSS